MQTAYKTPDTIPCAPEIEKKSLWCAFGFHKLDAFSVGDSKCFICDGMRIRFFCRCGKQLSEVHKPTSRSTTFLVHSNWDGMGGNWEDE